MDLCGSRRFAAVVAMGMGDARFDTRHHGKQVSILVPCGEAMTRTSKQTRRPRQAGDRTAHLPRLRSKPFIHLGLQVQCDPCNVPIPARRPERTEDLLQDLRPGQAVGDRLVGEADPVEDHVLGEREEVFGDHVMAAVDQGAGTRGLDQGDPGAGASNRARGRGGLRVRVTTSTTWSVKVSETWTSWTASIARTSSSIAGDRAVFHGVELGLDDRTLVLAADAEGGVPAEDFLLLGRRRIRQSMAEHEPVELGFGQLERAGLLDRGSGWR